MFEVLSETLKNIKGKSIFKPLTYARWQQSESILVHIFLSVLSLLAV